MFGKKVFSMIKVVILSFRRIVARSMLPAVRRPPPAEMCDFMVENPSIICIVAFLHCLLFVFLLFIFLFFVCYSEYCLDFLDSFFFFGGNCISFSS